MRVEFIPEGSKDCPLLLFCEGEPEEAEVLRRAFLEAANREVALEQLGPIRFVGGGTLTARPGHRDRGVRQTGPTEFAWEMTPEGWTQVAGLLEPFIHSNTGWQQLSAEGQIAVIFSPSGEW